MIHGDDGDDTLYGSAGDDQLFGDAGDDALLGGLDDDALDGGTGNDTLFGGWGDDTLNGLVDDPGTIGISDSDTSDYLNGGGGDDLILTGQGDIVTAGEGADQIVLGDWIAGGQAAEIMDFEGSDDSLLFVWDDTTPDADVPEISVEVNPENTGQVQIFMGGQIIATLRSDSMIDAADISLIPLSSAQTLGLTG